MIYLFDYATLKLIWWADRRPAARRLRHPRRLRPRRGHAAAVRRAQRRRAARRAERRRADVGGQPGVVHHGGRRDLRRVAARLRHRLLRLLRRADPDAVRAVPPAGRLRLPQQGRRSALAQRVGLGAVRRRHRAGARLRRRVRQPARSACRSISTATSASTTPGSFAGLLNPFGLTAGLVSVAMLTMHGGFYLQLRTEGAVQARALPRRAHRRRRSSWRRLRRRRDTGSRPASTATRS